MSKNEKNKQDCPNSELLSSYYDNELDSEVKEVIDHFTDCPNCQKELDAYRKIDNGIKSTLAQAVPDDLSTRILAGFHKQIDLDRKVEKRNNIILFNPIFMRVAASAIVCGGLLLYAIGRYDTPANNNSTTAEIVTPDVLPKNNQVASTQDFKFVSPESLGLKDSQEGEIQWNDLQRVSLDKSNPKPNLRGVDHPKAISNNVRHVWVVNNLDAAKQDIKNFVKSNNIPLNKLMITPTQRGTGLKVNLRLSKAQLVTLVKDCYKDGFSLVSSQAPEPNDKLFVGKSNAPVQYNAEFILSNDR